MWVLMENGGAINNDTGEEIYTNFGHDGLIRVYRDKKIISAYHSVSAANNFIEEYVDKLNARQKNIF